MTQPMTREDLQKTVRGRLAISYAELRQVHVSFQNVGQEVLKPDGGLAFLRQLQANSESTVRQSLLCMTEALMDLMTRTEKVETIIDQALSDPPPNPRGKRSH